jgi:GTPase SAR1 family protein
LRLAQHEADFADNYETKVQILSDAYHEQQIFVRKVFDDTIKHRLEAIEQHTKENTIEQLRLLRQKHENAIVSYLRCCTELHKSVPLTGLTGNIVAKVAHTFYHISSPDQIQLGHNWQSCELPLTRTFIQFKADKSTSFERNESRRLLIGPETNLLQGPYSRTETSNSIWQRLVSAPYMMSMVERDRYVEEEENVTEENIIRTKRWSVILGDPGSGKTSFARWLVRHLAQTLLLNGQHSTEYGPLRVPIIIRIGEFADLLNEQPSLTLFEYIGKHKWMGKAIVDTSSISLDNLSSALQDYIRQGQALIILDGLDEIPVSDQRSKIINVVENFVETYAQTPTGASALDNAYLSKLFDDPSQSGGNQVMITSRIVGYHAAPLGGQFAHYTIRPMDMEHMNDFVDYWFFRVHQHMLDILGLTVPNQGENHGQALKKELEKTENVGLLDVASNSCLMSFVCSVAFGQLEGSPLPTQRILLYEQIVNSMLSLWSNKRSTISIPDVIRILSDIATHIHAHSASGLIHEEKMKDVCIQSIRSSIGRKLLTEEDVLSIESQASDFVRIIREDVGILAARGESLYGFLHLTFQEYFTCLKLIDTNKLKRQNFGVRGSSRDNEIRLVAQSLRDHTNNPRFRVPIALHVVSENV